MFVPSGRIPIIRPNFPTFAASAADRRYELRTQNLNDPEIAQLNAQIAAAVKEHKQNLWHQKVSNITGNYKKLWSLVKAINNPQKRNDNITIKFDNSHISNDKSIAPHPSNRSPAEMRKVIKSIHSLPHDIPY